jgi:hypothetical protein
VNESNPYQPPQLPAQGRGNPQAPVSYRQPELPDPPNATLIFVLGLLSVLGVCFVLGPIAWIMGSSERARVRAGMYRDNGLLTAGYIMGIISTLLMILPLMIGIIWLLLMLLIGAIVAVSSAGVAL